MGTVFATFLDFLAPPRSLTNVPGVWLTEEEGRLLRRAACRRLNKPDLERRGVQNIDILTAGGTYAESFLLREAICRFKYRNVRVLASELGELLRRAARLLPPCDGGVLCAVPLHWTRWCERGINQAEVLAQSVVADSPWPLVRLLKRTRATGHQAHRGRIERLAALQDAFAAVQPCPEIVILVDDVATSGSTLDACAAALKRGGAKTVHAVVVALGEGRGCLW